MEEERQEVKTPEPDEAVFEMPGGITGKLYYFAQILRAIREEEKNPDKLREYNEEIQQELMDMSEEIRQMMEELYSDDLPEKVAELTRDIDDKFDEASSLHLDAVEMMLEYIETAQENLIDQAMETLEKAGGLLEHASMLAEAFSEPGEGNRSRIPVNLNLEM